MKGKKKSQLANQLVCPIYTDRRPDKLVNIYRERVRKLFASFHGLAGAALASENDRSPAV